MSKTYPHSETLIRIFAQKNDKKLNLREMPREIQEDSGTIKTVSDVSVETGMKSKNRFLESELLEKNNRKLQVILAKGPTLSRNLDF